MDSTTSDCQPIAFDSVAQLDDLLSRLRSNVQAHIDEQCKGKDAGFKREMDHLIETVSPVL